MLSASIGTSNQLSPLESLHGSSMHAFVPVCACLIVNFIFGLQVAKSVVEQNLISKSEMTKIGTAHLAIVSLAIFFLPISLFALIAAALLSMSAMIIAVLVLVHLRAKRFRDQFVSVLSLILLKMKSGKAFRAALLETVDESVPSARRKLAEIVNVVSFSQQNKTRTFDFFLTEVIHELVQVDQTPHSAIQRLTVFRDRLQIENEFRHKSGQAMAQARAQSLIMSVLYAVLFAFVVRNFGFHDNEHALLLSAFFFLIGSLWIWFGGKGFKWKV